MQWVFWIGNKCNCSVCIIKNVKTHTLYTNRGSVVGRVRKSHHTMQKHKGFFLPLALTHLRSQDLFEVILIFNVCGLLFPGVAIVTQWHPLVVTVRNNTSEEKEDKEEMLINTNSVTAHISHLQ